MAAFYVSVLAGGIQVTPVELFRGLFIEYDRSVAIIYQLRFPRIFVAMLGGAMMAVSGVLMQAVMRNPLAEPGIIGVSSGAAFVAALAVSFFPALALVTPLISFLGGMLAFALVYSLAWNGRMSPLRLILVGVAVNAMFTGLSSAFSDMTGGTYSGVTSIINANISLKDWDDVKVMAIYTSIGLILAFAAAKICNLLALSDETAGSLGVNVNAARLIVALLSVLLASIFTAIIGADSVLGLIEPQLGRLLLGSDHRVLLPSSALEGGLL
ncbi:MAG: iron ABC transporter permease, partial [Clostridiales bacterium]|nr:iron ABC transporter permease [Clostridiales bacterium]